MCNPTKSLSSYNVTLLALIVAGLFLWAASVPGFMEMFVLDESSQSVENSDAKDLKDGPPVYWSSSVRREAANLTFINLAHIAFFLAGGFFLPAAIFRLKLVLLTPQIGPPYDP
jgi:hypothetical protein